MVKSKDYFKDLVLDDHKQHVDGIEGGLEILGRGTFLFDIKDDDSKVHTIRIPNSVYVPGLRYCLLTRFHPVWISYLQGLDIFLQENSIVSVVP